MMTIIYIFYVEDFSTYDFNLNSHNNNRLFIMFLRIIVHFSLWVDNEFRMESFIKLDLGLSREDNCIITTLKFPN